MAKPTPQQLNTAKQQWEGSEPNEGVQEDAPSDIRADKPRIFRLAKAMTTKGIKPIAWPK